MTSIIIPTFNREKSIYKSVSSILNQTINDIEVIVVDDGSTDNTYEVISNIHDDRIVYIKTNHLGACNARNVGINLAKGEYIAFNDSDDEWFTTKLEEYLHIQRVYSPDFICSSVLSNSERGEGVIKGLNIKSGFLKKSKTALGCSTQTFFGKKTVFEEESFDINMPRLQDYDLMIRLKKKFNIYYYNKVLVKQYIQNDSISMAKDKLQISLGLIEKKYSKVDDWSYIKKDLSRFYSMLSNDANSKQEAISFLIKSIKLNVKFKTIIKLLLVQLNLR
ncbi:MAG: glycosyltransferase family 2 protein [Clostridia bacterium]|nr:glycosyltransferase family 2 protein [Clostridia bacterium]